MVLNVEEALGEWYPVLKPILQSKEGIALGQRLAKDELSLQPALSNIFRALKLTPPHAIKVVILGQDPYPNGHADGLAFSSGLDQIPYSLQMIFSSMEMAGLGKRKERTLDDWAKQGVLLLNATLTTTYGQTEAHAGIGWSYVITTILDWVAELNQPLVAIAWGTSAKEKIKRLISWRDFPAPRLVLEGTHPAAMRYGYIFKGGAHFLQANEFLVTHGIKPIIWNG